MSFVRFAYSRGPSWAVSLSCVSNRDLRCPKSTNPPKDQLPTDYRATIEHGNDRSIIHGAAGRQRRDAAAAGRRARRRPRPPRSTRHRHVPVRLQGVAGHHRRPPHTARRSPPALAGRDLHQLQEPILLRVLLPPAAVGGPARGQGKARLLRGRPLQRPPLSLRPRGQPGHGVGVAIVAAATAREPRDGVVHRQRVPRV